MAIQSTELWAEQGSNMLWVGPGLPLNFIAKRGWMVTGPPGMTDAQARAAVPIDGAQYKIPQIGDSHPADARAICTELPVEPGQGPLDRIVRATYRIPDASLDGTDPLSQPPIIRMHIGSVSLPADIDADGNAIVNSAYDTPDQTGMRSVAVAQMNIQVNAPLFLASKAIQYSDTVNSDRFQILGAGFLDPGQCRCAGFSSITGQRQGQQYVTVNIDLEMADLIKIGTGSISFFDLKQPDIGYNAYGTAGKGPITFKSGDNVGERVPIPVSLNGLGAPLNASDYGVGRNALAGVSGAAPPGATVLTSGKAVFLGYKMKTRRVFAGLI